MKQREVPLSKAKLTSPDLLPATVSVSIRHFLLIPGTGHPLTLSPCPASPRHPR